MRHGSLFTGISGFDLAATWLGWQNVFQVELDSFCQKVLAKNFPEAKRYGNIKTFEGSKYNGYIDIISGGFPCQPFSRAGRKKGTDDPRFLWKEMFRIIQQIEPTYMVFENVIGFLEMEGGKAFDILLTSLEGEGYSTESFIIPAGAVGASHKRDRMWVVAYPDSIRSSAYEFQKIIYRKSDEKSTETFESFWYVYSGNRHFEFSKADESRICRMSNGFSKRLDNARVRALGNAVVPQVAYELFKAIDILNR